jgi:AAA+ ATPase superfamily predicted ATPase
MEKIIGRERELKILKNAIESDKAELIAIYGRRRVGKTFLIREAYKNETIFDVTGVPDGSYEQQLSNFHKKIVSRSKSLAGSKVPSDWQEAFDLLSQYINTLRSRKKKVLFIDEFPWMHTQRSKFISLFAHFWNDFCTKRSDLVVVVCGSAASFMINKVIKDKKGLHNRITHRIRLSPFSLYESKEFLKSKRINLTDYDYLQIYMAVGGVPHYLEKIQPGDSVATAMDRLCFSENAFLSEEFDDLFVSLFDNSENHEKIVNELSKSGKGLTRGEIVKKTGIGSGGRLTTYLKELSESGFISQYKPLNKKVKETLYRLSDEYSLFYIKFIKNSNGSNWATLFNSRSYISWGGFAFEILCLKHVDQIKRELKIGAVASRNSTWRNENAQIDLVIDRADNVINLCELKFYNQEFTISKKYKEELINKKTEFSKDMSTRKNLFTTMVTTYGVKRNTHSDEVMDIEVTMTCLFQKP